MEEEVENNCIMQIEASKSRLFTYIMAAYDSCCVRVRDGNCDKGAGRL